jgi:PGF-pre-PGF domain-containing protein
MGRKILSVLVTLLLISLAGYFVFGLSSIVAGNANPLNYTEVNGTITLNVTVNTTNLTGHAVYNVTFRWVSNLGNGLNTTVHNSSANQTIFQNLTFDTTLLPDGNYSVNVSASNLTSTINKSIFLVGLLVDNDGPSVTVLAPANGSNQTRDFVQFNFTINDNVPITVQTAYLEFPNATPFNTSLTNVSGNWNAVINMTNVNEGRYTLKVYTNNSLNNENNSVNVSIIVDRTAPTVTLNTSTGTNSTDSTPSFAFNFSDISFSASCALYINGLLNVTNSTVVNNSNTIIAVPSPLTDNVTYTVSVNCTDGSGNVGNSSVINITIFSIAPNVSILNPVNATNQSNNELLQFNASVVATFPFDYPLSAVVFQVSNGSNTFNRSATNVSSNWGVVINMSQIKEGTHVVKVFANDSINNVNDSKNLTIFVDRTGPTTNLRNTTFNTTDSTPTFKFNFTDLTRSANCSLFLDGVRNASNSIVANNTDTTLTISDAIIDGIHTAVVNCTDGSGNIGNSTVINITVDTAAPTITVVGPTGAVNFSASTNNVTFNISVQDASTRVESVKFSFNNASGASFNYTATNTSGYWGFSYNVSSLGEGVHVVTIFANDTVNNLNNTVVLTFAVDNTPPSMTPSVIVAPSSNISSGLILFNATVTDNASGVDVVVFNISNGTTEYLLNVTSSTSGHFSTLFNAAGNLSTDSGYNISIRANDTSGNLNSTQAVKFQFYFDLVAPTVTLSKSSSTVSSITLALTTSNDVSTSCTSNFGTVTGSGTAQTITYTGLQAGKSYEFTVSCVDEAGNTGTKVESFSTSASTVGGSGSSGSSGGISSTISGKSEKKVWTSINKGETASVAVKNGALGVTGVTFDVAKTVYGAWIKVAKIDSLPGSLQAFSGKVYRNIQITPGLSLKANLIKNAKIDFKVEKAWLEQNGLAKGNVAMFRHNEDKWNELSTSLGEDDGTYVHYTATTPGFSYFIIAEKTGATAAAGEEAEAADTGEEVGEEAAAGEAGDVEDQKVPSGSIPVWVWVILALIAIGAIAGYLWNQKR